MSLGVRAVSPSSSVQCVGCHEQRPFTQKSYAHLSFFLFFSTFLFNQFGEMAVIMAAGALAIGPRGMPKFARQAGHALGTTVRYVPPS